MIIMTSGSTRIGNRVYSAADGPFSAGTEAEKRLVRLGVARYVGESGAHSPAVREEGTSPSVNTSEASPPAEGEKTTFLDAEQFSDMNYAQVKKLAKDMGLDVSGVNTKAALIEMICSTPVEPGVEDPDGEAPPDLAAEEPVV